MLWKKEIDQSRISWLENALGGRREVAIFKRNAREACLSSDVWAKSHRRQRSGPCGGGNSIQGRRASQCKGPESGVVQVCLRSRGRPVWVTRARG